MVFNERNLIRLWDISYDGYVGGKDASILDWGSDSDLGRFIRADNNLSMPYGGPSIVVLPIPTKVHTLPSPLPIANLVNRTLSSNAHALATADLFVEDMTSFLNRTAEKTGSEHIDGIQNAISVAYDMLHLHRNSAASKCAGLASMENEATLVRLAYGGTYSYKLSTEANWNDISGLFPFASSCFSCFLLFQSVATGAYYLGIDNMPPFSAGCGHHGPDYVGAASVRSGKGVRYSGGGAPRPVQIV